MKLFQQPFFTAKTFKRCSKDNVTTVVTACSDPKSE